MKKNSIYQVMGGMVVLAVGAALASCAPGHTPAAPAAFPSMGPAEAPFIVAGKTLILDHSQAEVAQLGTSPDKDFFSPAWQKTVQYWIPASTMPHTQWDSAIPFTSHSAKVGENTYTYSRILGPNATITGTHTPAPGEHYPNGKMQLKFVAPTEAEAQYLSGGEDGRYFLRNVRVYIK